MATDEFTNSYTNLLDSSYDCVDRFVLNADFGRYLFAATPRAVVVARPAASCRHSGCRSPIVVPYFKKISFHLT
jgi:hypothetical protein